MPINYIICAAGQGTRFQPLTPRLPKPLIRLQGKTLLEWSLESLPLRKGDRVILITRTEDAVEAHADGLVEARFPEVEVIWMSLAELTRGQLETAYLSRPHWLPGAPLVIFNCDTYCESPGLLELIDDPEIEGIIPCSREPGDAWSFCAVDDADTVTAVTEKVRISEWASAGLYFFRDPERFIDYTEAALAEDGVSQEFYVAPLYTTYLEAGNRVVMDRLSLFRPMGTPQQVADYWGVSWEALQEENIGEDAPAEEVGRASLDE